MAKKKSGIEVVALVSFGALIDGEVVNVEEGQIVVMPEKADWIKAKLVKPVVKEKETATLMPAEKAVVAPAESIRKPKARKQ